MKRYLSGLLCRWGVYHSWQRVGSPHLFGGRVWIAAERCATCPARRNVVWRVERPGEVIELGGRSSSGPG